MQNKYTYIPEVLANEVVGLENFSSFMTANPNDHTNIMKKAFGQYGSDTTIKIASILRKYIPSVNKSEWTDKELKLKMMRTDISKGLEAAAKEFASNADKFGALPTEVQAALRHLKNEKTNADNNAFKKGLTGASAIGAKWKKEQAEAALESALFTVFAGVKESQVGPLAPGMETYSYQSAIVYPKLETQVQWIAACATMYTKVIKIKQLYNKFTSIPVHTLVPIYQIIDPETHTIVKEFKREDVLSFIDPKSQDTSGSKLEGISKLFKTMTKKVSIKKANFRQLIKLRSDLLFVENNGVMETQATIAAGQKSAINADELVRSDFYVEKLEINGQKFGPIYDINAGRMLTETNNEQDYKGKVLLITPDQSRPTDTYYLYIQFNGQDQSIVVDCNKAHGSAAANDVDAIDIEFKILDPFNLWKSRPEYALKEERGYINAGPEIKDWVPILQDQLEVLDERLGGSYFARIMNMATEFIGHRKEGFFFNGYFDMKKKVIEDFTQADELERKKTLYAAQTVDLQIATSVRKLETINVQLGPAFQAIANKFRIASQSQKEAQLTMFTSSYHLGVFAGKMTAVVGEVSETADNTFLGVNQEASVNVLTIGDDIKSPISAIIVGTDKSGLEAKTTDNSGNPLAPDQIKYTYNIIPSFAEPNIQTCLASETPIRITNDPAQRNPMHPNIPSLCMDCTFNFNTLRGAAGDLAVYGYNTQLIP